MTAAGSYWAGTRWITPYGLEHLNKVADLLGVAERDRRKFVETIAVIVLGANLKSNLAGTRDTDSRLLAAAKAVRTARGAVAKLTLEQRRQLGALFGAPVDFYWAPIHSPSAEAETIVVSVIKAVDEVSKFIGRGPYSAPSKRGRPSGTKDQWDMHEFVNKLWQFSCVCGEMA